MLGREANADVWNEKYFSCSKTGATRKFHLRVWLIEARFPAKVRDFSFVQNVQTGFGDHPTSCSVVTGGSFCGVKRPGLEADWPLTSNLVPRLLMDGNIFRLFVHVITCVQKQQTVIRNFCNTADIKNRQPDFILNCKQRSLRRNVKSWTSYRCRQCFTLQHFHLHLLCGVTLSLSFGLIISKRTALEAGCFRHQVPAKVLRQKLS